MINQRDGVIAELLRSEACTLWASRWLAFQHIATKAFPSLDFDLQVPNEEEAEEFVYDDEVDPEVLSDTPSSAPLPSEAEIPAEAGSSSHPPPPPPPLPPIGALPYATHGLEARTTEATRSSTPNI